MRRSSEVPIFASLVLAVAVQWACLIATCVAAPPADLRTVATAHYVIHTDIPDAALVEDLGRRMDVMYDQYAEQLRDFHPAADAPPFTADLFLHRDRYAALTRFAGPNSGGVFVAGRRPFLAAYLDGQDRDPLRRTLQHEAFHQFAYFTISRRLPVWLNEGLAQVFEEGIWAGDHFLLGQVPPRRVRQLQVDLDHHKLAPLDKFLATTPQAWSDTLRRDALAGGHRVQPRLGGRPVPDLRGPARRPPPVRRLPPPTARAGRRRSR